MQVIWFKRDLRIRDHAPLARAAKSGPCVCLYVYEPELLESAEFDASHLIFINQSLRQLDEQLQRLGGRMVYRVGAMPDVLDQLHREFGIDALWSHEETGNDITFRRDRRVKRWARDNQVDWHEIPQNGVVRPLKSRDGWARQWATRMNQPLASPPSRISSDARVDRGKMYDGEGTRLAATDKSELQIGGETNALAELKGFLRSRGERYQTEMSSPGTAWKSCSRLSPYLAWGCVSIRTVFHRLRERQKSLKQRGTAGGRGTWPASLSAFQSRLSWHCHFMQKLEDEPRIEFENMCRAYDGMREDEFNQAYFDAWCHGQTGYPLIDACMRALHQHSWINFRMRAMLVSFASYHLWLHWRPTAQYLARHFLDFEPGIHFSQFQMQSGTTGINTVRIYSPIKQVQDQDPQGEFIRRFVPELAAVPLNHLAEPHKMSLEQQSQSGCRIGKDYPKPVVDHLTAYRSARTRIYAVRRDDNARSEARAVHQRHGSRRKSSAMRRRTR